MNSRINDVLGDHDAVLGCVSKDGIGCVLVTSFPIDAVIVGLPLKVIADDRRVGVERLADIDHGIDPLVFNVDQLQGVTRRVSILGNDERHLLMLESNLVGGQHRLHIV